MGTFEQVDWISREHWLQSVACTIYIHLTEPLWTDASILTRAKASFLASCVSREGENQGLDASLFQGCLPQPAN